ncbi:hypothetical protein FACS1894132_06620 [Clostridia bacterium]|nr:hypothetical protein FACS1894132_06620 [Clostridia bacterium]
MKIGRTMQELAVELNRQNTAKRDFVVNSTAMEMSDNGFNFKLNRYFDGELASQPTFGTTDLFHRQVGSVLNIPAKYYDKMRSEYPSLLAENVNGWLDKKDSRHTIRTLDGTARAFLSDRYRRIDNAQIAEAVLPVISEMPDARVESCEVTDDRMYLKVVNPRLEAEVTKGDVVQSGIVISNSEVGLGSVSVMPLIFRLVCTNGMIAADSGQRKYHIGRQNEEDWELFSDETLIADDRVLMMKLADTVRTAVDAAKFAVIVDRLRESTEAKITAPIVDVVELTGKQYGFTKSENDGILQHLITGGDLSLYGLSNAVTRTAADVDSYDRATALEGLGYQIVTMPPKMWREMNEVAL